MFFVLGWTVFGAFTGWLASKIVHKRGQGCLINMALGLVGAVVGGAIFRELVGFEYELHGFIVSTFVAVIGAIIVLVLWNALADRKTSR